ncbi:hypothetical protein CKAH01_12269 [Colletotrichum kahawae]|uniref:Uncharacterized protein n=1 Tax=Colletotrichum kahawae TaxID=34407 RepID=A0AAD9YT64_COLKA|nr:hypothetical protein CKAH01_12269 [Colletotrichum kahawae]
MISNVTATGPMNYESHLPPPRPGRHLSSRHFPFLAQKGSGHEDEDVAVVQNNSAARLYAAERLPFLVAHLRLRLTGEEYWSSTRPLCDICYSEMALAYQNFEARLVVDPAGSGDSEAPAAANYSDRLTLDGTLVGVLSTAACLIRACSYATLYTSKRITMCSWQGRFCRKMERQNIPTGAEEAGVHFISIGNGTPNEKIFARGTQRPPQRITATKDWDSPSEDSRPGLLSDVGRCPSVGGRRWTGFTVTVQPSTSRRGVARIWEFHCVAGLRSHPQRGGGHLSIARAVASLTRADEGQRQKSTVPPLASLTSFPDRGLSAGDFCLLFRIIMSRDDRQSGDVIDLGRAELDLCQESGDVSQASATYMGLPTQAKDGAPSGAARMWPVGHTRLVKIRVQLTAPRSRSTHSCRVNSTNLPSVSYRWLRRGSRDIKPITACADNTGGEHSGRKGAVSLHTFHASVLHQQDIMIRLNGSYDPGADDTTCYVTLPLLEAEGAKGERYAYSDGEHYGSLIVLLPFSVAEGYCARFCDCWIARQQIPASMPEWQMRGQANHQKRRVASAKRATFLPQSRRHSGSISRIYAAGR